MDRDSGGCEGMVHVVSGGRVLVAVANGFDLCCNQHVRASKARPIGEVERGARWWAGGVKQRVQLRVDRADTMLSVHQAADLVAMRLSRRGPVVAGADDAVVEHEHGTNVPAGAGGPGRDQLGERHEVVRPRRSHRPTRAVIHLSITAACFSQARRVAVRRIFPRFLFDPGTGRSETTVSIIMVAGSPHQAQLTGGRPLRAGDSAVSRMSPSPNIGFRSGPPQIAE